STPNPPRSARPRLRGLVFTPLRAVGAARCRCALRCCCSEITERKAIAMKRAFWTRSFQGIAALLVLVLGSRLAIGDTTLLLDNFDGTHGTATDHPSGLVDTSTYRVPFGGTANDGSNGPTDYRFTLPSDGVSTALVGGATGSSDGKVSVIPFDTYNPNAAG